MPSRGRAPAVQGRGAQAAALADALASQGRTRARMASLTAYGNGGRWRDPRAPGAGGRGPGAVRSPRETSGFGSGEGHRGESAAARAASLGPGKDAQWGWRLPGTWEGGICKVGGIKTPKI